MYYAHNTKATVYVPNTALADSTDKHRPDFAPKSAIVALTTPSDDASEIQVDYEGNLYGAENLERFITRVQSAHGRAVCHYPTTARSFVAVADLIPVASYDPTTRVLDVFNESTLAAWLSVDTLPIEELRA